jgi:hypothetical protein
MLLTSVNGIVHFKNSRINKCFSKGGG